jgi:hypothetical protein
MPDLKHITIAVISIAAREGGNGVITLRFTNPCDDADFYLHMPVRNLNKPMPDILKDAANTMKNFATSLGMAAGESLQFSQ